MTSPDPNQQPAPAPKALPEAVTLQNDVKQALKTQDANGASDNARSRVVKELVEHEMSKREETLADALKKRSAIEKEIKAVKPNITRNGAGEKVESFTDADWKKREKLQQKLAKFDKLFDAAIATPNTETYNKLREFKG